MRFAVYVRRGEETYDKVDEVPEQLRLRTLAVRAFDDNAMMVGWELVDGRAARGRDRAAVRQSRRRLSAHPLRGAGLLRGARRAELIPACHSGRGRKLAGPESRSRLAKGRWMAGRRIDRRPDDARHAALRRSLCLPWKFGATSRMKRSISSFTMGCGFMPTLK